jgi:hypothetical protein
MPFSRLVGGNGILHGRWRVQWAPVSAFDPVRCPPIGRSALCATCFCPHHDVFAPSPVSRGHLDARICLSGQEQLCILATKNGEWQVRSVGVDRAVPFCVYPVIRNHSSKQASSCILCNPKRVPCSSSLVYTLKAEGPNRLLDRGARVRELRITS